MGRFCSRRRLAPVLLACLLAAPTVWADHAVKAAVFDFEMINTNRADGNASLAEVKRLALVSNLLRRKLTETGNYVIVDTGPAASLLKASIPLHGCNGCETDIARGLGAEISFTGTVHKVSNLILMINLTVRNVATGETIDVVRVNIRGNSDKSWSRGISYIFRNYPQTR